MSAVPDASSRPVAPSTPLPDDRASRTELWILGIYFTLVVALSDIFNVRLGVELLTLVVLLPAILISRRPMQFLHDWWFFLAGLIMWNLSGPIAAASPFKDHAHLDFMLNVDRALFFGRDPVVVVQNALAHQGHVGPLDLFTAIVYNMHLTEPYVAGYFLWRLNRLVFLQFCASALILLVLGFISFILFPAIPPWLAASNYGKVQGVFNGFGPVLRWHPMPFHGTPLFYIFKFSGDRIAAFPSEHAGFPLLELLAFARVVRKPAIAAFSGWVLLVLFTIVYLGEHWVTDALAGYIYAVVIFGFVVWFSEVHGRMLGATARTI